MQSVAKYLDLGNTPSKSSYTNFRMIVSNCIVRGNQVRAYADASLTNYTYGGGLYLFANVLVTDSEISHNQAEETTWSGGAGMNIQGIAGPSGLSVKLAVLDRCIVRSNYSGGSAAGIRPTGNVEIRNSLISYNTGVYSTGGGIYISGANNAFINCTVFSNSQFYAHQAAKGTNYNCIILDVMSFTVTNAVLFYNCNTKPYSGSIITNGANNITNDPAFAGNGNFHLQATSPCVNTGTNLEWITDNTLDLDRKRRADKYSGRIDMGCYEFLPQGTLFMFSGR